MQDTPCWKLYKRQLWMHHSTEESNLRPLTRSKTNIYDRNDIYLQICIYMFTPTQSLALGLHLFI